MNLNDFERTSYTGLYRSKVQHPTFGIKYIARFQLNKKRYVKVLGYVTDATLQWLYKNSFAFVYPSLFEGFGLPVLEAMAMGAAVITSNSTSIPEVVGDAGYLIDPLDEEDIYKALLLFQENQALRNKYAQKSLKQAAKFSWDKTAQSVLSIYEEVLSLPKLYTQPD